MLCFSSQRTVIQNTTARRTACAVPTVIDVVVMSSILDYYLSCLYHCIAAEYINHSDNMFSLLHNDLHEIYL